MKILALTRYGPLGASSRVRTMQYTDALAARGIDVEVSPLLGDEYVADLYAGRTDWRLVIRSYLRRVAVVATKARKADVLWVEKELWPWLPAWLERLFMAGKPVVLDYDDAIFHNYDLHRSAFVRRFYGHKIDALMRRATVVVVGNDYLGARARTAQASRVVHIPTVVSLDRYLSTEVRVPAADEPIRIVWIGTPGTVRYLKELAPALVQVARDCAIEVRVIGATVEVPGVPVVSVAWSAETEAQEIARCDIGVMPLPDSPWERGKCGYKLIQYMACGMPVVASPVGVNAQLVRPGVNGFLASSAAEWAEALVKLASDRGRRAELGAAGRRLVETEYSLSINADRLAAELRFASASGKRER